MSFPWLTLALFGLFAGAASAGPLVAGQAEEVRGGAVARRAAVERPLSPPGEVFVGETLATAKQSRAQFRLGQDTRLRMGAETRVRLDRFLIDKGGLVVIDNGPVLIDKTPGTGDRPLELKGDFGLIVVRANAAIRRPQQRRHWRVRRTWRDHGDERRQVRRPARRTGRRHKAQRRTAWAGEVLGRQADRSRTRQRRLADGAAVTAPWRLRAVAASVVLLALLLLGARSAGAIWRERVFDALLAASASWRVQRTPLIAAPIAVVDIDRASVNKLGPWPWRRGQIARLVEAIAKSKPRAIGVDIVFEGPEARSPAALARLLAVETRRDDLAQWAATLPDDDAELASALALAPVALAYALDPEAGASPPDVAFHTEGRIDVDRLWRAPGARAPEAALGDAVAGFGAAPLPGDADGVVRRAPALVVVAGAVRPGLALETLRLALAEPIYALKAAPDGLTVGLGDRWLTFAPDGMTRLPPGAAARRDVAVRSAAAVLADSGALPSGAVVLLGASIPEAGALRASASDPLVASTRLQAAALAELRDGGPLLPARALERDAPALAAALAAAALAAGLLLSPAANLAALAVAVAGLWAVALVLATRGALWDPTLPSLAAVAAGLPPTLSAATDAYRRERRIRRRFEQHLAPEVVRRIVANPGAVRLAGERRQATALFTDIEGFTELTTRLEPAEVVRLLDGYFEGLVGLIHAHGGMVDKFVGDAVHAFFNLPVDQKDHVEQAILCAFAISAWSENHRRRDDVASLRLGRTRIGVESGAMIAGEVGAGAKLDYTAYGEAVNLASRLEAANKRLGTQVCVGPDAAQRAPANLLRPTGRLAVAGLQGEVATFGPWPDGVDARWRQGYRDAWNAWLRDEPCAEAFARLHKEAPDDVVSLRLSEERPGKTRS